MSGAGKQKDKVLGEKNQSQILGSGRPKKDRVHWPMGSAPQLWSELLTSGRSPQRGGCWQGWEPVLSSSSGICMFSESPK